METMNLVTLPAGLTVNKAIAMWQASNGSSPATSASYAPDTAIFGAGELHGAMPNFRFRRPRAPKATRL